MVCIVDITFAQTNEYRWLGFFNAVSAFNNSGMSLLDLNMVRSISPWIVPLLTYPGFHSKPRAMFCLLWAS